MCEIVSINCFQTFLPREALKKQKFEWPSQLQNVFQLYNNIYINIYMFILYIFKRILTQTNY